MSLPDASKKNWLLALALLVIAVAVWAHFAPKSRLNPLNMFSSHPSTDQAADDSDTSMETLPPLLPGDTCDRAFSFLDTPTEQDEYGRAWVKEEFNLAVVTDVGCNMTGLSFWVEDAQKAMTPDKIVLGKTTFSEAERILGARVKPDNVVVEMNDDLYWEAAIVLDPTPTFPFKVIYRSSLPAAIDAKLKEDPTVDTFKDLPMTEYNLNLGPDKSVVNHDDDKKSANP